MQSSFFSRLIEGALPPPRLLTFSGSGLEVSEHSIKYLTLKRRGSGFSVGPFGYVEVPDGVIVGGEIRDQERLASLLREVGKRSSSTVAHVSLPEQKGYLFQAVFPRTPELNIAETLAFTLEEHVPLSPEEAVFDYDVLSSESDEKSVAVIVTAFPRKTVESYYDVLTRAGFTPLSLEIESQAMARALVGEGDAKTYLVVDFGETRTAISVVDAGAVRFTTSLEIAGASLSIALRKEFNATPEEIERLKNEEGISRIAEGGKVSEILMNTISALRDEIQRHFIYWHTHREEMEKEHRPIDAIILTGGNANLRGLSDYLEQSMSVKVKTAEVWTNVCDLSYQIPPIPRQQSFRYGTVIGLALRGHRRTI